MRRMSLLPATWWSAHENHGTAVLFLLTVSDVWPELYSAIPHIEPKKWKRFIDYNLHENKPKSSLEVYVDESFEEFVLSLSQWKDIDGEHAPGFELIHDYEELNEIMGALRQLTNVNHDQRLSTDCQ